MKLKPLALAAACLAGAFSISLRAADGLSEEIAYVIEAKGDVFKSRENGEWTNVTEYMATAKPIQTDWQSDTKEIALRINIGDVVRTGENGTATVKSIDGSLQELLPLTSIRFGDPSAANKKRNTLLQGVFYFFSRRDTPDREFATDIVTAAIKGTEFVMSKSLTGEVSIHLVEGAIDLSSQNDAGSMRSTSPNESVQQSNFARVSPTGAISISGVARFSGPTEWFAYYPIILLAQDIPLAPNANPEIALSLAAYQAGDYRTAAQLLATPISNHPGESLYRAALALASGQVQTAAASLEAERTAFPELASILRSFMDTVQGKTAPQPAEAPIAASAWIVRSYREQRLGSLDAALRALDETEQRLTQPDPVVHTRRAELLFSQGRYENARNEAQRALALAPKSSSARTLLAYLELVAGNAARAETEFAQALQDDPSAPAAYLGRALLALKQPDPADSVADFERAVALSPLQASYRSYLAQLFIEQRMSSKAATELQIARELAPEDPNIALASGLLAASRNQTRTALAELRAATTAQRQDAPLRSNAFLPGDEALRRANLAQIFSDAALETFALREANRATTLSPSNVTSHKFLAQAYDALLDPSAASLRYQSPARAETLQHDVFSPARSGFLPFATTPNNYHNLLAPIGATGDIRLRAVFKYGYSADAQWRMTSDQTSAYLAARLDQLDKLGEDWNFERQAIEAGYKRDVGSDLTLTGVARNVTRRSASPSLNSAAKTKDTDEDFPSLLLALRKQWSALSQSAVTLQYIEHTADDIAPGAAFATNESGDALLGLLEGAIASTNQSNAIQAELQHQLAFAQHSLVLGLRGQTGNWNTRFNLSGNDILADLDSDPLTLETTRAFERAEAYLYGHIAIQPTLTAIAGLNLTRFEYPLNAFTLPPSTGARTTKKTLPKLGLLWTPDPNWQLRAAYTESLGGLALEDGNRLEPTHVAGFLQGYRSLLAESLDGTHPALAFEQTGVGITYRNEASLFVDLEAVRRSSGSNRGIGRLYFNNAIQSAAWNSDTHFYEDQIALSIAKLLGEATTLGFDYAYSDAQIDSTIPAIAAAVAQTGTLSHYKLFAQHRSANGFFGKATIRYALQDLTETTTSGGAEIARDTMDNISSTQLEIELGWRSTSGDLQISIGGKNLTNEKTRISPINWTPPTYPQRLFYLELAKRF